MDERLKNLVELKGAQMIGCEFCVDLGSQICRNSGFSDQELLALPRYRQSDLFTEREKLALDYAVAVMRTPVEVTDELFARMKEHFSDEQMVEITALLTVVNLDRFNAALNRSRLTTVSRAVISTICCSLKCFVILANRSSVTSTGVRMTATV